MNFIDALLTQTESQVWIGEESIKVTTGKFRDFLNRLNILDGLMQSLQDKDYYRAATLTTDYLKAWGVDPNRIEYNAHIIYLAFSLINLNSLPDMYPMLKSSISKEAEANESLKLPYDYDGRIWASWIHKLAKNYGWSKDQILDLNTDEVAAYIQECEVDGYYEYEKQRALSEVAYEYNKTSKTSKFRPSPKPFWMSGSTSMPETIKIPKKSMPVGAVMDLSGLANEDWINEQNNHNNN